MLSLHLDGSEPVLPQMCMTAGVVLASLPDLAAAALHPIVPLTAARRAGRLLTTGLLLTTTALSLSRIAALRLHYGAPMRVYSALPEVSTVTAMGKHLPTSRNWLADLLDRLSTRGRRKDGEMPSTTQVHSTEQPVHVCVGGEWHRFPSSFFLPSPAYRLAFVQSSFGGLLPTDFDASKVRKCRQCTRPIPVAARQQYVFMLGCAVVAGRHHSRARPLERSQHGLSN